MTNVLKLHVTYSGRHGGDVDEILIIPEELNGVLFRGLAIGETLERAVSLGEIEGKHSSCFGDLHVSRVNLDELNPLEFEQLVKESSFSSFESFFEEIENDFEEEDEDYDEKRVLDLLDRYKINKETYGIKTSKIHDKFIWALEEKVKTEKIIIANDDYEKALKILKENNIQVLNLK